LECRREDRDGGGDGRNGDVRDDMSETNTEKRRDLSDSVAVLNVRIAEREKEIAWRQAEVMELGCELRSTLARLAELK
jgi:hypothetical protein